MFCYAGFKNGQLESCWVQYIACKFLAENLQHHTSKEVSLWRLKLIFILVASQIGSELDYLHPKNCIY